MDVDDAWLAQLATFQTPPVDDSLLLLFEDDEVVRPECARRRYAHAGEVVLLPSGGHDCWPLASLWSAVDVFLIRHGLLPELGL